MSTDGKRAVIWWRVSTDEQLATSPETQKTEARSLAEREGYTVVREIGTDWGSLEVWDSPPMRDLCSVIEHGDVDAVFVYDPDRLPAIPVQRLLLRTLCRNAGVALRAVHGEIVDDGPMGVADLADFVTSWGKLGTVLRAQQGARQGLHDLATKFRRPTNHRKVMGYDWHLEGGEHRLSPNDDYGIVELIFMRALEGGERGTLRAIAKEAGLLIGRAQWSPSSVRYILRNPLYAGRFAALRNQVVTPQTRRSDRTYGRTAVKEVPEEQWVYLDEVKVEQPIITWEERTRIIAGLTENKELAASRRVVTHDKILNGHLYSLPCGERYYLIDRHRRYVCKNQADRRKVASKCSCEWFNADDLDKRMIATLTYVIGHPEVVKAYLAGQHVDDEAPLRAKERSLLRDIEKVRGHETQLAIERIEQAGQLSDEAWDRAGASFRAKLAYATEELERTRAALRATEELDDSLAAFEAMATQVRDEIGTYGIDDWRKLLDDFSLRLTVDEHGTLDFTITTFANPAVYRTPRSSASRGASTRRPA